MKKINYGKILPGMIVGSTATLNPLSMTIRVSETSNGENVFNPNISSHVFAICQEHDLLYGMEMSYPRIHQPDLNEYEYAEFSFLDHIVFVADPFGQFDYDKRDSANKFLLHSHYLAIKYDVLELLRWWNWPVYDDPAKLVCGDLTYAMMKALKLDYPAAWDTDNRNHDPWDQQKYFTDAQKTISWWR